MTGDTGPEGITGRQGQEVHIPFRWYHQHIAMQEGSPVLAVLFIFTEMLEIQLLCEISHLFFFILETSPLSFFFFKQNILQAKQNDICVPDVACGQSVCDR